ncbi:hypothetical protein ACTQ49_02595 [Luteococcus sp. Sow4_B9]|uniref:hypothetical protein n=1 Tax=Luteococcus sp. Sow4_B9 TaxID=3438792 RepID=UPI003F978F0E
MTGLQGAEALPRALTSREREVLVLMLQQGRPDDDDTVTGADRERWLAMVPSLQVVRRCACSECPTVDFSVADTNGRRVALSAGAPGLGLVLFIDDDRPSCLEGFPIDGGVFPVFPPPRDVTFLGPVRSES